jgi:hypothetical protein
MLRYALILHPAAAVGAWWPGPRTTTIILADTRTAVTAMRTVLSLFQRIIPTDGANCFGTGALPTLRA